MYFVLIFHFFKTSTPRNYRREKRGFLSQSDLDDKITNYRRTGDNLEEDYTPVDNFEPISHDNVELRFNPPMDDNMQVEGPQQRPWGGYSDQDKAKDKALYEKFRYAKNTKKWTSEGHTGPSPKKVAFAELPAWMRQRMIGKAVLQRDKPLKNYWYYPMLRGSDQSRLLVGSNWTAANAEQRKNRADWGVVGRGAYRSNVAGYSGNGSYGDPRHCVTNIPGYSGNFNF